MIRDAGAEIVDWSVECQDADEKEDCSMRQEKSDKMNTMKIEQ